MHNHTWLKLLILSILLTGCKMLPFQIVIVETPTQPIADLISTFVAQTAAVQLAQLTSAAPPAATQAPPTEAATAAPTDTTTPTNTSEPTLTAPPTNTPIPCNRASFVEDITYPDNAEVAAEANFTKTWRLRNNGSCTWTSGYSVIFDHGDRMSAPDWWQLTSGTVAPGGTIDVSVNLKSPASSGTYQGFYKMRAADNSTFGINADGQGAFWVKVVVPAATVAALPDLRVTGMDFSMNPPKKGVPFVVTVQVKNKGEAAAGAFAVQWWSSWAQVGCNWAITSLAVNEEKTLTCNYTYASWSTYDIKAVADPANSVVESNEGNNVRSTSYQVQP